MPTWTFLVVLLPILCRRTDSNDELRHRPKLAQNYRYFVAEIDQTYRILGSCTNVKKTKPMSRCIIQVRHKYQLKYLSLSMDDEMIGSGVIIFKRIEDRSRMMTVVTAFHIVVPQFDYALHSFLLISLLMISFVIIPFAVYYRALITHHIGKLFLIFFLYVIISACLVYYLISIIYPFMFNSSIKVHLGIDEKSRSQGRTKQIYCELISSRLVLSNTWWDDIGELNLKDQLSHFDHNEFHLGIIQCSNIHEDFFNHLEACKPKLNHDQSLSVGSSVNVIGFVGRPPASFDLVVQPHYSSFSPLLTVLAIDGKTPDHFLPRQTFMNCSGDLRLFDQRRLFIDTPSTYGFSGGPCFFLSNSNSWEFHGILTGTTRLWNTCLLFSSSSIFQWHYHRLTENLNQINSSKTDL